MDKKELKAKLSYLHQQNRKYTDDFTAVPVWEWPKDRDTSTRRKVFRSKGFLAQVFWEYKGLDTYTRITVNRTELDKDGGWKGGITWDELMKIKFQLGFGDEWAVEIFPCQSQVVNVANMRHLWIVPKPDFAWCS